MSKPSVIEACARAAHEANRAYCIALDDSSQAAWDDAPAWQRASAMNGVLGVFAGNGPEQSHESWLAEKAANGWKYGAVKDPEKKEHPCFVPYAQLPDAQKAKDGVFVGVVRAMRAALEPSKAMTGNARRRALMAQVEARTTSDYPRGLDCEGCPEPATRRDIVGVPLCQGCWDECASAW